MLRKSSVPAPDDQNYSALLNDLKLRIRSAQIKAAVAVNQELILLYWHIGREILTRQQERGWGAKVIAQLSQDLKREFPDMKGFSARNLTYMRTFANAYPDLKFTQQAAARIPWFHNCTLLDKVQDITERLWYIQQTIKHGWSRTILLAQIETGLYQREGAIVANFESTLPPAQSELAYEVLKDQYSLEFLTIAKDVKAQDLKRALVDHMRDFLLELGIGFSFVRQNYHLEVDGTDFYLDMLFYHLQLRCFIVIQLEMEAFKPEHSGMMNFYLSGVDEQERKEHDQPTIGIILCKTKGRTIAEYSLRHLSNPIAIAEHRLPKVLPSTEQLQLELDSAVQTLDAEPNAVVVEAQSNEAHANQHSLIEAALEIQRLLKLLEVNSPDATDAERQTFVTLAIPVTLRQQAASALDSAGKEVIRERLEGTYVEVAIGAIEQWVSR